MKTRSKKRSAFINIIIYINIIIVVLIIALISFTSFYYSNAFKKEINDINKNSLHQIALSIENNFIAYLDKLYIDNATDQINNDRLLFFYKYPLKGNHSQIYDTYINLVDIQLNTEALESIHLFIPDKNILLSSQFGIKYLEDADRKNYHQFEWFKNSPNSNEKNINLMSTALGNDENLNNIFVYSRIFPYLWNLLPLKSLHYKRLSFPQLYCIKNFLE